jgi:molecular chaperone GrpE
MMVDDAFEDAPEVETSDSEDAAQDEVLKLLAENAALKEQALRYAADAENTKRRAEREANDARAYAIQKFARDLLDAADSLARAVEHAPKDSVDPAVNNMVMGVEMTEKALQNAFERNGLKRVAPVKGEKFDPNLHQAMMEQPVADVAPGSVVQVMQTGYELLGRLVRPAMVVVTPKATAAQAAAQAATETKAYVPADGDSDGAGGAVDQKA